MSVGKINIDLGNTFKSIGNFGKDVINGVRNFASNTLPSLWDDFTGKTSNRENLDFQKQTLEYNKQLQQLMFQRDDNSYTRTVNDMIRAGLNPVSMNGTNSSGEAIATSAPQSSRTSDIEALNTILSVMSQLSVNRNNNTLSNAQSNLINAQAENQRIKNLWESDILEKSLENMNLSGIGQRFKNERENIAWLNDRRALEFNRQFNLSDNMPDIMKYANILTNQGNLKSDDYKAFSREWSNFGKTFNDPEFNSNFSNLETLLERSNLKGALQENAIGQILLKMLGIN